DQTTPRTKKEIISPTESFEDILDWYKRIDNTLEEKNKTSDRSLISK
ncbi:18208_t:CDS:1, partial [Funneliformis geosporum]